MTATRNTPQVRVVIASALVAIVGALTWGAVSTPPHDAQASQHRAVLELDDETLLRLGLG